MSEAEAVARARALYRAEQQVQTRSQRVRDLSAQVAAATVQRDLAIRTLAGMGVSSRGIAELAGLSHTQIQNILTRDQPG